MFGISSLLRALLGNQPLFTIEAGGADLRVVRFHGQEGISSLFGFRLELAGPEIDVGALVDKPAALRIEGIDAPRFIHGVLSEFEYVGESRSLQLYEAELVPWIWRLQHRQDCRIFQDKPTPKILEEVLTGAGLAKDWLRFDLVAEYAPRNYCVQYHETDLAFLMRLMEEDGIFYFFEHEGDKHVLVMADHPGAHKPIPGSPAVWFSPPGGDVADREHVREFRFGQRVKPGKASLRDFNIHKPDLPMEVNEAGKLNVDLEVYHYPGEYQDPSLGTPDKGLSIAKTRLEAHQAFRRSGGGTSDCPRLTAGHTFELMGHPRSDLETTYRVTHVTHAGSQPQVLDQDAAGEFSYSNEFGVTEKSQPFRAAQRTPKPQMRGLQTATVVGPPGEEVHPDEHGRVKIQFHWDRAEPFNDTSSCWVRVSQLWAGNSWGTMFIPRIGHEVLVDFIEGDPDRPIVVGRIHTGNNMPRYEMPASKTRTTIRSESSPGGGGFNELSFEDAKGKEELFLHAQKDWNAFAQNDKSETVGANRSSSIGSNETVSVGASRTVNVAAVDSTTVGGTHVVTIAPPPPVVIKFPEIPFLPPIPPLTLAIPPTTLTMTTQRIELSTGYAKITIAGPNISLEADANISLKAKGDLSIDADGALSLVGASVDMTARGGGDVKIQGGPMVKINC
jgi:type VI secretion system secreted protein VgrG